MQRHARYTGLLTKGSVRVYLVAHTMLARLNTPLRQVLVSEGRTQAWLARTLGVKRQQVGQWVHGIHRPAPATQTRIAAALGRTVEELFPAHDDDSAEQAVVPTDRVGSVAA